MGYGKFKQLIVEHSRGQYKYSFCMLKSIFWLSARNNNFIPFCFHFLYQSLARLFYTNYNTSNIFKIHRILNSTLIWEQLIA